jgi:hypothetical protein
LISRVKSWPMSVLSSRRSATRLPWRRFSRPIAGEACPETLRCGRNGVIHGSGVAWPSPGLRQASGMPIRFLPSQIFWRHRLEVYVFCYSSDCFGGAWRGHFLKRNFQLRCSAY